MSDSTFSGSRSVGRSPPAAPATVPKTVQQHSIHVRVTIIRPPYLRPGDIAAQQGHLRQVLGILLGASEEDSRAHQGRPARGSIGCEVLLDRHHPLTSSQHVRRDGSWVRFRQVNRRFRFPLWNAIRAPHDCCASDDLTSLGSMNASEHPQGLRLGPGCHSVNPYFVVDGVSEFIAFLTEVFDGREDTTSKEVLPRRQDRSCGCDHRRLAGHDERRVRAAASGGVRLRAGCRRCLPAGRLPGLRPATRAHRADMGRPSRWIHRPLGQPVVGGHAWLRVTRLGRTAVSGRGCGRHSQTAAGRSRSGRAASRRPAAPHGRPGRRR